MKEKRLDIGQSENENENQMEVETPPSEIDLLQLANLIIEKLRSELEIENERTGRA